MEKQPEIFYDMDNTLLEMSKYLVGSYSGKIKSYGAINDMTEEDIVRKLHEKGLFAQFTPIQGAVNTLKRLTKTDYKIGIISQPMINEHCISEKNYTLEKYFPFIDLRNVTYTFNKYLLSANNRILIDDHIHHLENWEKMGGIAICFTRGYNKKWKGLRITKHSEIFEILEHLEKGDI